jgi:branched-chain amino acid aminotransferase
MSELQVFLNDRLVPRDQAVVSVWDSGFQSGDAVYEGIRVYDGKVFRLKEHVERLFRCAHAIGIEMTKTREEVIEAVLSTVRENHFTNNVHIRMTVSRGDKPKTGMDPRLANRVPPTFVVIAEPKEPTFPASGIRIITSSVRRTPAQCLDSKLHTCNQLGQILAKAEANHANADEALMLDVNGFVAETNSANFFIVRENKVLTSTKDACLPGITRGFVIDLAKQAGYDTRETNISLGEVYMADEAFVVGTICEVVPVLEVDGRIIGDGSPGPVTLRLREAYIDVAKSAGVPILI